jgi:type IV pilus assembly protein PilV
MNHARRSGGNLKKSAGFSMVEVLVSIIVLSFGLLGMVGLQAAALKGNREARLQSVAAELARELGEMMRGNKVVALTPSNPYLVNTSSPLTPGVANYCLNVSTNAGCADGDNLAQAQMTEWLKRVDTELPGAKVVVCQDSAPYDSNGLPNPWSTACSGSGDVYVIKIGWTRSSTNRAATAASATEHVSDTGSRPGVVFPVTAGI